MNQTVLLGRLDDPHFFEKKKQIQEITQVNKYSDGINDE